MPWHDARAAAPVRACPGARQAPRALAGRRQKPSKVRRAVPGRPGIVRAQAGGAGRSGSTGRSTPKRATPPCFGAAAPLWCVVAAVLWAAPLHVVADAGGAGCSLHITGVERFDVEYEGYPRNNPDHTLYPNDMFSFEFLYHFGEGCISPRVSMVREGGAIQKDVLYGPEGEPVRNGQGRTGGVSRVSIYEANLCHGGPPEGGGGIGGYDSAFGEWRDCGHLEMTITAYYMACGSACRLVEVSDTFRITPKVVAPILHASLFPHMLYDTDGYPAMNLDGTYYAWDKMAIEHEAIFEFGDERSGTIQFRYDIRHGPLNLEGQVLCHRPCDETLRAGNHTGMGFLPYHYRYGNGGGMHAFAAVTPDDAGLHRIEYGVAVYNAGEPINANQNHTVVEVVPYEPSLEYHPYMVMDDGAPHSYGNRHGIMIKYSGSGEGLPNPERRAKINGFDHATVAHSESVLVEPHVVDRSLMRWNSSWALPYNGTEYDAAVKRFYEHVEGNGRWPAQPYHSNSNAECQYDDNECHAMFMYGTHGAVRFAQDITNLILEENKYKWYRHVNTTNQIKSEMWAGRQSHAVAEYVYEYAGAELSNVFGVEKRGGMVHVMVWPPGAIGSFAAPDGAAPVTIPMDQYVVEKTLHDTGDAVMAAMHLSEMYGMEQQIWGNESVSMRVNKTALTFWGDVMRLQNYTDIMEMPMHEALEFEAHLNVTVSAGNVTVQRFIPYEFDVPYSMVLYGGEQLEASAWRQDDLAYVMMPRQFGMVAGYESDRYVQYGMHCDAAPCSIAVPHDVDMITVYNEWGDSYEVWVRPAVQYEHSDMEYYGHVDYDVVAYVAAPIVAMCVVSYVAACAVLWMVRARR